MKPRKNFVTIIVLIFIGVLFSGCQPVLPVLALRPMDFITIPLYYLGLSFIFGGIQFILIGEKSAKQYIVKNMWLTPVYGIISISRALLKII